MKCPECEKNLKLNVPNKMKILLDHSKPHPTGASGGGIWHFRTFVLYKCMRCWEHFYVEGKRITARPLKT